MTGHISAHPKTIVMRSLLLAVLILPFFAGAQINRSAKELASERIQEYIVNKLFKNKQYSPVSFGEIKAIGNNQSRIVWELVHNFEITDGGKNSIQQSTATRQSYKFLFYLDEKMKVVKAETYFTN